MTLGMRPAKAHRLQLAAHRSDRGGPPLRFPIANSQTKSPAHGRAKEKNGHPNNHPTVALFHPKLWAWRPAEKGKAEVEFRQEDRMVCVKAARSMGE